MKTEAMLDLLLERVSDILRDFVAPVGLSDKPGAAAAGRSPMKSSPTATRQ
jgi:hypothetical protein